MTLQSVFFCLKFSIVPPKHDFLYLSLHISKWNESKLPMFIKIYTIRRIFIFIFILKKLFGKVSKLPKLSALRFFSHKWSYLFICISYENKNCIPKFSITLTIFAKVLKKMSYIMES